MERIQKAAILKDLAKKIVFITGPRQAGKTWLAKEIALGFRRPLYLNYDRGLDRSIIESEGWVPATDLIIFDELHKKADWKNYIKGVFDTKPAHLQILVTGSARLDSFSHMGDSLAGRYFMHRLLPFSPAELHQLKEAVDLDVLIQRSGFPEPFLATDPIDAARWRQQYVESMITIDATDFEAVQNVRAMRTIFNLLRSRVGSTVSYQSLAEDVAISPTTVKKYVEILESLYIIFRVTPYSKNIARSLLKEPKIYFFDVGLVDGDEGAKFENLVAVSLLKHVFGLIDYQAKDMRLHYIRDKDKHEIDFVLVCNDRVEKAIEVKHRDATPSKVLVDFSKKYGFSPVQVVKELKHETVRQGVEILTGATFLRSLAL